MKKTVVQILRKNLEKLTGTKGYMKFVVVTSPRTGSNLLMSYLASHPNMYAYGELFNHINDKSCKEIWSDLFSKKLFYVKAVGFKIFYKHPLASQDREVWDLIQNDPDIKIIHLLRKNPVRSLLSLQIAYKTDIWGLTPTMKDIPLERRKINIDVEDFISRLRRNQELQHKVLNGLAGHKIQEINYESLVKDQERVLRDLFSFLEVPVKKVSTNLRKQNFESISDLVLNYDEFESKLSQTEFKKYLYE